MLWNRKNHFDFIPNHLKSFKNWNKLSAKNDPDMLKLLKTYEAIDKNVAKAVFKGFLLHLQYQDNTQICLFDENVTLHDKKKIISSSKLSGNIVVLES